MKAATIAIAIALSACAQTTIYQAGKPVARFQGDMTGLRFHKTAAGDITLTADTVDHSAATLAQGQAAAGKMTAGGAAIAAAGITTLIR